MLYLVGVTILGSVMLIVRLCKLGHPLASLFTLSSHPPHPLEVMVVVVEEEEGGGEGGIGGGKLELKEEELELEEEELELEEEELQEEELSLFAPFQSGDLQGSSVWKVISSASSWDTTFP